MKNCACLTHEGSHKQHMDAIWKEQNSAILKQARAYEQEAMRIRASATTPTQQQRIEYNRWIALMENQLQCYLQAELCRLSEVT